MTARRALTGHSPGLQRTVSAVKTGTVLEQESPPFLEVLCQVSADLPPADGELTPPEATLRNRLSVRHPELQFSTPAPAKHSG